MQLTVAMPGLGPLARQVKEQLGKKAKPILSAAANEGAKVIVDGARLNLRKNRRASGQAVFSTNGRQEKNLLDRSMGSKISIYGDTVFVTIGPRRGFKDPVTGQDPANIAHLVEGGRKEVHIEAKKVLSDGTVIYGTTVEAVAPEPFLRPALNDRSAAATDAVRGRLVKGLELGK